MTNTDTANQEDHGHQLKVESGESHDTILNYVEVESIKNNKMNSNSEKVKDSKPLTCDMNIATELHVVDNFIDPNYHWNEWTARREILKHAKLIANCKTKGSQTNSTYFHRDNTSQVYLPKDNESQTKHGMGTNPKIATTYLTGLTASSSNNYEKKDKNGGTRVTLTFDL